MLQAIFGNWQLNFNISALQKELESDNVKVQLVTPMFICTNMISYSYMAVKSNIFVPNAEQYVKSTIKKLDKCSKTNGYWAHTVQVCQNVNCRGVE
jgi:short-subunit dehydrogenase